MNRHLSWYLLLLTLTALANTSYAETIKNRMVHEVVIERSMEDVFNYATTASNWKKA